MPAEEVHEGRKALEQAWWEALSELRDIAMTAENPEHRISASRAILEYCTSINVGIGEPFIPQYLWDPNEDEDEDEGDSDD